MSSPFVAASSSTDEPGSEVSVTARPAVPGARRFASSGCSEVGVASPESCAVAMSTIIVGAAAGSGWDGAVGAGEWSGAAGGGGVAEVGPGSAIWTQGAPSFEPAAPDSVVDVGAPFSQLASGSVGSPLVPASGAASQSAAASAAPSEGVHVSVGSVGSEAGVSEGAAPSSVVVSPGGSAGSGSEGGGSELPPVDVSDGVVVFDGVVVSDGVVPPLELPVFSVVGSVAVSPGGASGLSCAKAGALKAKAAARATTSAADAERVPRPIGVPRSPDFTRPANEPPPVGASTLSYSERRPSFVSPVTTADKSAHRRIPPHLLTP